MSINIHKSLCIGCGRCKDICPGSLLLCNEQGKAYIAYPSHCWGCASCVKECPVNAISMYLGADIGGTGGQLTVEETKEKLNWKIQLPDGEIKVITVSKKDSNQY